ncbi:MAG: hypothetical protein K0S47_2708 [Herbinix sp.]|nr:hypothetical protein [Herbinix sp.]
MKQKRSTKQIVILVAALVAVIAILAVVYTVFKPEGTKGSKEIVAEVIIPGQDSKEFTIKTDALFLREALEEIDLIKGSESEYGLFVTDVNGVTASEKEWWAFTLNGEMLTTGVDDTPVNDGDHFEITLTEIE